MKCERCHRPLSRTSAAGHAVGPTCAQKLGLSQIGAPRPARGPSDDHTADLFAPPIVAQQGHLYQHGAARVIALATGDLVPVGQMEAGHPWFVGRYLVNAAVLRPLPMTYFGGQVPR